MFFHCHKRGGRWPGGYTSDSGSRDLGFEPQSGRRVVSLSKTYLGSVRVNTDRGVNTDGELQIPIKKILNMWQQTVKFLKKMHIRFIGCFDSTG